MTDIRQAAQAALKTHDALISRLANCRSIAADRIPKADLAAIDDAIATLAQQDAPVCTCPSGDGSLRWPCPAHPAAAQAAQPTKALSDMNAAMRVAAAAGVNQLAQLDAALGAQPRQEPQPVARVLDPCSGSRMMWFDRGHPDAVFGDQRSETLTVTDRSHGNASGTRTLRIEPDVLMDFRALPFGDSTFRLVAFDPPHLVRAGPRSWLAAKYGKLRQDWRDDLRQGFAECFRVLNPDGVLVFKWNETQVKVSEVLALTPHTPLFGHPTGRKGLTHWLVFMKPSAEAV